MNTTTLAALITAITALIGAVTGLVIAIRHITNHGDNGQPNTTEPPQHPIPKTLTKRHEWD